MLVFFSRPGTGLDPASSLPVRMMQIPLRLSQPKGSTPPGLDCLSVAFGVLFDHSLYIKQCGLSGVPSGRARAEHGRQWRRNGLDCGFAPRSSVAMTRTPF